MERNLDEVIIYLKKKSERYRVLLASDDLVQQSYNTGFTKFQYEKYAEESEYLVDLLEELKAYRAIGTVEECRNSVLDILKAYNKAIDDFVKFANTMPTVEEDDGTIRPMWLEEIAEQLKVGRAMIRVYDEYGNIVDLVEWEKKIRSKAIDDFKKEIKGRELYNRFTHYLGDVTWLNEQFEEIAEQLKAR